MNAGEMTPVERALERLGGIATTAELLHAGIPVDWIAMAWAYGRIVRIRKGWYARLDVPDAVIRAVRVGGRLACQSALDFHDGRSLDLGPLHVSVPRRASRLRTVFNARQRLAEYPDDDLRVHWTRSEPSGDRWAVSREEAQEQASRCWLA